MSRVLTRLHLLQNTLAGETKAFHLSKAYGFFCAHLPARRAGFFGGLGLLRFDGFALPSSCHAEIIVPEDRSTGTFLILL